MPGVVENSRDAAKGGAVGAGIGAVAENATNGLSRAAEAAGDVLRGIFGGLPWEMDASGIVDAVSPGVVDATSVAVDLMGVAG